LLALLVLLVGGLAYLSRGNFSRVLPAAVTHPATLHLRNRSMSQATFYVDGQEVCDIMGTSGKECTIELVVTRPRELAVNTSSKSYRKVVSLEPGAEYQLLACGPLGTPDQDCGLFVIRGTPPKY
jgi:hypothetical protein